MEYYTGQYSSDYKGDYYTGPYGKFIVEPLDGVCRYIAGGGFWDEFLKPYFDGLTKEQIVLDIGAHVGQHSVYLARRCKQVYSFEPQLVNYDRLVKNCELNSLTNVTCFNIALYNKNCKMAVNNVTGQYLINYAGSQACSLQLYENEGGDVEARTLDSFGIENVSFIKCDTENTDLEVMEGAIETIKRCRPLIIFEDDTHRNQVRLNFFNALKYDIKEIAASNYLATPK